MQAAKTDRRVLRTQKSLGDALVALTLERGYEAITIKDLTERADVAYVTFFRHYKDIDDLMFQVLQGIIEDLAQRVETALAGLNEAESEAGQTEGYLIFQLLQENTDLYRILLTNPTSLKLRKQVLHHVAAMVLKDCEANADPAGVVPPEVVAYHVAHSLLGLIEWWLENDQPYSLERMAQIYQRLIIRATLNALSD